MPILVNGQREREREVQIVSSGSDIKRCDWCHFEANPRVHLIARIRFIHHTSSPCILGNFYIVGGLFSQKLRLVLKNHSYSFTEIQQSHVVLPFKDADTTAKRWRGTQIKICLFSLFPAVRNKDP